MTHVRIACLASAGTTSWFKIPKRPGNDCRGGSQRQAGSALQSAVQGHGHLPNSIQQGPAGRLAPVPQLSTNTASTYTHIKSFQKLSSPIKIIQSLLRLHVDQIVQRGQTGKRLLPPINPLAIIVIFSIERSPSHHKQQLCRGWMQTVVPKVV